jgi:hypothetical protein
MAQNGAPTRYPPLRWAPRIAPHKLRVLYRWEGRGLPDPELLDDVGLALLLRCESILLVSAGRVRCPACAREFALRQPAAGIAGDTAQPCPATHCGWTISWHAYHASWTKRRLYGGKAVTAFRTFADAFPRAPVPRVKMMLIDRLLHAFHWDLKAGAPNRLAANNLIEGSHGQTLALLDELSGTHPDGDRQPWRDDLERMLLRRRARR